MRGSGNIFRLLLLLGFKLSSQDSIMGSTTHALFSGEIGGITTDKCLCVGQYVIFMGKQGTEHFALSQIAVFGIPINGFHIDF